MSKDSNCDPSNFYAADIDRSNAARGNGRPWVVVLAESDPALNFVLAAQLQTAAAIVLHTATDGPQTMKLIRERIPELLILEISMPGLDGFEIIQMLRSDPQFCALPIIVHTAQDLSAQQLAQLTLGPTHLITKTKAQGLVETVLQVLSQNAD